jgi:hypothetical protein
MQGHTAPLHPQLPDSQSLAGPGSRGCASRKGTDASDLGLAVYGLCIRMHPPGAASAWRLQAVRGVTERQRTGASSVDSQTFDRMIGQLARVLSRRSLVGGSLGAAVLSAVGLGEPAGAKKVTAEACIPTGKKCPAKKPRGDKKSLGCDRCCQDFVTTIRTKKGKRVKKCACTPNGVACGRSAQCCSGFCSGGICSSPSPAVAACDPHSGLNCVPRGEECSRGGTPCCCQDECLTGDSARGTCAAPCRAGTQRCNEGCLPFCQLGEPHAGGCAQCVCPPETSTFGNCTLGTAYPLSDVCCGGTQVCCRQGELDDPDTILVCCDRCASTLGNGCASP